MIKYMMKKGEGLQQLSRRFGLPVCMFVKVNLFNGTERKTRQNAASFFRPGREIIVPDADICHKNAEGTYRVKEGDTLFALSEKFGIPMTEIIRRNGLKSNRVTPEMRLDLKPEKGYFMYTVHAGETVPDIARRFSVDLTELMRKNGITTEVYPGMQLLIRSDINERQVIVQ